MTGRERLPFVGRERELNQLYGLWACAADRQFRAVFIAGEPGIGKTSLVDELAREVRSRGGLVLWGRCDDDVGIPYQPIAAALDSHLVDSTPEVFRAEAGRGIAELSRLLPTLSERIRDLPAATDAEPEAQRYLLFEAVAALMAGISAARPTLLVVEDLQWAATPTLLMLRHLLRSPKLGSLLVVGTYRDTEVTRSQHLAELLADLRDSAAITRISIGGMEERDVMAYIAAAAGRPLLAAEYELVTRVHAETEGNPFFISEVLRHLVDEGAIPLEDGRWIAGVNVAELGIPEGVRAVIGQRLAALSDHTNRVLAAASVAGREFDLDLLERVDDAQDGDVLDAVEEAIQSGLVVESDESVGRFTFAHALVRQTLYADLSAARRALLHRRVGEAIETLHGAEVERHLVELAHHFTQAAFGVRVDKAVDYGSRAAQQATEQLAYEEAMAHLERALSVLDMADQRDLERRFELLIAIADVRFRMLDPKGMKAAALEAADIARVLGSPERLVRSAAACGFVLAFGAPDDAIVGLCEEALTEIGDRDPKLRAQVLSTLAAHLAPSGAGWSVAPLAIEAVELARRAEDVETLRGALVARFETLTGSAEVDEALPLAEELIALSQGGSLQRAAIDGYSRRAVWRLVSGDRDGFEADDAHLERLADETRWTVAMAWCRLWRAVLAMLNGDFEGAETRATEALALAEEDLFDAFSAQLLWLRFEQGRIADLKPLAEMSAEANPLVVGFQLALAFAQADMGELADARRVIEGLAGDGFASVPRDGLWPASLHILTEVVTTLADEEWAATLYELVVPHSGLLMVPGAAVLCMGAADRCLGMLATVTGRYEDATRHFDAALALETAIDSAVLIARTRYWYGSMLLRRDGDGDRERGVDLLYQCIETAEKFQMARLVQQADTLVRQTHSK